MKYGFIGGGNMASAIIGGMISGGLAEPCDIMASCKTKESCERLKGQFKIEASQDNQEVARDKDVLFLAVKPNMFETVIPAIRDVVGKDTIIVSIAAGKTIAAIEEMFQKDIKLIRVMPNTPALVGAAMSALTANENVSEDELQMILSIFESMGEAEVIKESMMDAVIGVSGSSPAYVYMFIEAMADAAVADGMPRAQAYKFAAQSVYGAAKMVLETKKHPGELKDAVCSPGGTTIEAVAVLEEEGFRNAVIKAQRACVKKSKEMGQ